MSDGRATPDVVADIRTRRGVCQGVRQSFSGSGHVTSQSVAVLTAEERRHVEFIRSTLVPDLRESGKDFTAEDFEATLAIIDRLTEEPK
jgi:hypothetical protein